jgi:hypothetical protein
VRRFQDAAARVERLDALTGTLRDTTADLGAGLTTVRTLAAGLEDQV